MVSRGQGADGGRELLGVGTVCDVARRHGLAPTQLTSRRGGAGDGIADGGEMFAPVVVEPAAPKPVKRRRSRRGEGGIELEIDGVVVRVGHGAEAKTVAAVIKALKAER